MSVAKMGAVQEKSSPKMGKCPRPGKSTRKDIFAEVGVDAEAVSRIFLLLGDFFPKMEETGWQVLVKNVRN
jgi:hypothetical protein